MSDWYYYIATISYYTLIVTGSILIKNVDQIFEFIATISVNALGFIFPSVFYLLARKQYAHNIEGLSKSKRWTISAK